MNTVIIIVIILLLLTLFIGLGLYYYYSQPTIQPAPQPMSQPAPQPAPQPTVEEDGVETEKILTEYSSNIEKFIGQDISKSTDIMGGAEIGQSYFSSKISDSADKEAIKNLKNDIIKIIPSRYKDSFSKCKEDEYEDFVMNINCFLNDFKQDPAYKKDIAAAAIVSGIIMGILAKGEKPEEKLKYDIERKRVEVKDPALRKELNMPDNASEVTLPRFLNILTAMKQSGKELMCKYCAIEVKETEKTLKVREVTVQNPDGTTTITTETYYE